MISFCCCLESFLHLHVCIGTISSTIHLCDLQYSSESHSKSFTCGQPRRSIGMSRFDHFTQRFSLMMNRTLSLRCMWNPIWTQLTSNCVGWNNTAIITLEEKRRIYFITHFASKIKMNEYRDNDRLHPRKSLYLWTVVSSISSAYFSNKCFNRMVERDRNIHELVFDVPIPVFIDELEIDYALSHY